MKWAFVIQQKLKAALLLLGIMFLVVLFNIIERHNIEEMNRSVNSIYKDRLLPAADIFHLTDNLYSKRVLMEQYLISENVDVRELQKSLDMHDRNIDELIRQFEKTYLVDKELVFFNQLKADVGAYKRLEQEIISLCAQNLRAEASLLYHQRGQLASSEVIKRLSELTEIQTQVGGELLNNSKGILANSDLLSSLQLILAMGIGVMVVILVASSKIARQVPGSFNLN